MNIINHILFGLDSSGSMAKIRNDVMENFRGQIQKLKTSSKQLRQETRISVYRFSDDVECLAFDVDVFNLNLNDINKSYEIGGDTALFDCILDSVSDLNKIPQIHGNHAFLAYYLTDAENNINKNLMGNVRKLLNNLEDNWTLGLLVPNRGAYEEARDLGFSSGNIEIWDSTSRRGVEKASYSMNNASSSYLIGRSKGITSTRSLFTVNTNLDTKAVKRNLDELPAGEYDLLPVREDNYIKPFVENWTGDNYRVGSGYYELMKVENIQANKNVCIVDKMTGKVYMGLNARNLLGLPNYEIKVNPNNYGKYKIFVQSTSTNRKLIRGTQLLVLK